MGSIFFTFNFLVIMKKYSKVEVLYLKFRQKVVSFLWINGLIKYNLDKKYMTYLRSKNN